CKERPRDDAPRLVLADWLDEFGDAHEVARAEFIRLQLKQAAGTRDLSPLAAVMARSPADGAREEELRREHEAAWLGPLVALIGEGQRVGFARGLLWVRRSHRAMVSAEAERLAGSEEWAWVDDLTIRGEDGDFDEGVFRSPLLRPIVELTFSDAELS